MSKTEKQLAVQTAEPSVALMLQEVIRGGITTDNVAALEKMCDLYERMEARKAERDFANDFNALMSEVPRINATKPVPNNDGTVRYKFAPLSEIDKQLRPLALKHGFTYSFAEGEHAEGRITKVCIVQHSSGHKRENQFTVRISAPPKSTDSQADGSTHSYAKRGALCDAFGIIVDNDDDSRMVGKPIGKALAEDLQARVKACGADGEAFLKFAGAANYEGISDDRFDALDAMLKRKESGKPATKTDGDQGVIW